ncbi:hypothetical protein NIES2135_09740 [Leptolyngbya boryana NIES-2135]|jgi:hypothetical protein|uniref:Uncharacterized protein n=1 Tax=Leptolyngbya boryana NIES-2135 TaxID=1973484 RepID=A0A1Z4JBS6_LEPBY|nr:MULTISPECIES: hypothetical protein [Leptolyngbya]BAY54160.1 hypothetical protein NIES2135_09740 [Leptolyngbya boryana NIES-2135]MBD2371007.1 hypothetical protein [Leptolyngbya sp. FACHB-161]MBD2377535.1 hypothetical protein [Leptolyngbya sp. FACHB-238]MBD2401943.1 hypothetical protein [Leptolyngbya sp. FACHB-239]MBD2408461.1 hypothetical protein [Leptolyngbya sp. FACHB-402]
MVKYILTLKSEAQTDQECQYTLDLQPHDEDHPERYFTPEVRETIRRELQRRSLCRINASNLNQIIKTWIEDIRQGYRDSTIKINLAPTDIIDLDQLQDSGNQAPPAIVPPDLSAIEPQSGAFPPLSFL